MKLQNLNLEKLFKLRSKLLQEGKDISRVNFIIECKESEYYFSLFENTSATGSPSGGSSVGGGGVAFGDASIGGMGAVVSSQPSNNTGVTTEPGYSLGGGSTGTDIGVPYNATGGNKTFQKIKVDNRKGTSKRRKNKMLAGLKQMTKKQDFTNGQSKGKKLMNFDDFSKDKVMKVTKVKEI